MAHFTNLNYFDAQDEFMNDENFDQYSWDFTSGEGNNFDQGDDAWGQMSMDNMDMDDTNGFKEDQDDFNGVF